METIIKNGDNNKKFKKYNIIFLILVKKIF